MSLRHTSTAVVVITTLLLAIAAPAGATTTTEVGTTTTRGTAATTSVPLFVGSAPVDGAEPEALVELGTNVLMSTTDHQLVDGAPWSAVDLALATLGSEAVGRFSARSDGTTSVNEKSFTHETDLFSVGATVGSLVAVASDASNSATAALSALATDVDLLLADLTDTADLPIDNALGVDATVSGVMTTVGDGGAAATHRLLVAGLDIDLATILGDALATLPLSDLLSLAGDLGVVVDDLAGVTAAEDIEAAITDLLGATEDADSAATAIATATAALINADAGTLEGLQLTIDGLTALLEAIPSTALSALESLLTSFDAAVLECTLSGVLTNQIQQATACVQAELDTQTAAFDAAVLALADELSALEQAVASYTEAVGIIDDAVAVLTDAVAALDPTALVEDIEALLADLLGDDNGNLLTTGQFEIVQEVRAVGGDVDSSYARHSCTVPAVAALDLHLPAGDVDGCSVNGAELLAPVTSALAGLFDTIGGVDAGNGITLELFGNVSDSVTEDADGTVTAVSEMEVLRLGIPDITVTPCAVADGLACSLGIDLEAALTAATSALGLDQVDGLLDTAFTTAGDALSNAAQLLTLIDPTLDLDIGTEIETAVEDALGAVQGALDAIDLGDLLTGDQLTIPGATIVVDPKVEAEHQVVAASVDDPAPADPAPADAAPADAAPAPTSDDPSLPNTGGGAALLAVLAIGAGAWLWRGRRREA